jgi:hypothetical protein
MELEEDEHRRELIEEYRRRDVLRSGRNNVRARSGWVRRAAFLGLASFCLE